MKAQDIMTRGVVTAQAETPVLEIADLLLKNRISGVPVVNEKYEVIGVISESDLLRRAELGTEKRRGRLLEFFTGVPRLADEYAKSHGLKARDVMTISVVCIGPTTPISEVADIMEGRGVKRLPVVDDGKLVGIITRANLVRAFAATRGGEKPTTLHDDSAIRTILLTEIDRHPWGHRPESGVVVSDGVVHFWGVIDSESEFKALRVAAEAVPGVKEVVDHTIRVDPTIGGTVGAF